MRFPVRVRIERKSKDFDKENPHLTYYALGVRREDGKAVSASFVVDENKWQLYCSQEPNADREKLLMDMFSDKLESLWNADVPQQHAGRIIIPD